MTAPTLPYRFTAQMRRLLTQRAQLIHRSPAAVDDSFGDTPVVQSTTDDVPCYAEHVESAADPAGAIAVADWRVYLPPLPATTVAPDDLIAVDGIGLFAVVGEVAEFWHPTGRYLSHRVAEANRVAWTTLI